MWFEWVIPDICFWAGGSDTPWLLHSNTGKDVDNTSFHGAKQEHHPVRHTYKRHCLCLVLQEPEGTHAIQKMDCYGRNRSSTVFISTLKTGSGQTQTLDNLCEVLLQNSIWVWCSSIFTTQALSLCHMNSKGIWQLWAEVVWVLRVILTEFCIFEHTRRWPNTVNGLFHTIDALKSNRWVFLRAKCYPGLQ